MSYKKTEKKTSSKMEFRSWQGEFSHQELVFSCRFNGKRRTSQVDATSLLQQEGGSFLPSRATAQSMRSSLSSASERPLDFQLPVHSGLLVYNSPSVYILSSLKEPPLVLFSQLAYAFAKACLFSLIPK